MGGCKQSRRTSKRVNINDAQHVAPYRNHELFGHGQSLQRTIDCGPGLRLPGRVQARVRQRRQDLPERLPGQLQGHIGMRKNQIDIGLFARELSFFFPNSTGAMVHVRALAGLGIVESSLEMQEEHPTGIPVYSPILATAVPRALHQYVTGLQTLIATIALQTIKMF